MVNFTPTPQYQNFTNSLRQGTGFSYSSPSQYLQPNQQPTPGQSLIQKITGQAQTAQQNYQKQYDAQSQALATNVISKQGGFVPVDKYGMPQQTLTNFSDMYNKRIHDVTDQGNIALQAVQGQVAFRQAKAQQDQIVQQQQQMANSLSQGYQTNLTPGATPQNPGAKAVQLAMQVVKNGTPYQWGGNSLKSGVDCSGLTQQLYRQLGISLPRTTYEQAKSGRTVSRNQLLPGDLIFYNTGRSDPNGIGHNSHVALYIGNGQVISAENPHSGIRIVALDEPGQYSMAIQPW